MVLFSTGYRICFNLPKSISFFCGSFNPHHGVAFHYMNEDNAARRTKKKVTLIRMSGYANNNPWAAHFVCGPGLLPKIYLRIFQTTQLQEYLLNVAWKNMCANVFNFVTGTKLNGNFNKASTLIKYLLIYNVSHVYISECFMFAKGIYNLLTTSNFTCGSICC